jgi:Domain of unknown function (DUF4232)
MSPRRLVGLMRWSAAPDGGALVVVAGACAAALALPASGLGSAAPNCAASQLSMRVVSFEDAGGYRLWQLAFKNLGAACSLQGFSRVALLGQNGHRIPVGFRRETGFPAATVLVEPGDSAFVAFTYLDGGFCTTGNFDAFRVKIFLPGARGGLLLNPMPRNNGSPIFLCARSERIYPVTSEPGP